MPPIVSHVVWAVRNSEPDDRANGFLKPVITIVIRIELGWMSPLAGRSMAPMALVVEFRNVEPMRC